MNRIKLPAFLGFSGGHVRHSPAIHEFRFIFQPGHSVSKGLVPIFPQSFTLCKAYPNKDGPTLWMWDENNENNISSENTLTHERKRSVEMLWHMRTNQISSFGETNESI